MTTIAFTVSPVGGRYAVRFKYDAGIVELIKQTIPGYARSWDAPNRCWYIDPDWTVVLAAMLRTQGHVVVGLDEPRPPRVHHHIDGGDWARQLFRAVGPHRRGPVYRAMSRILHPDVATTGDTRLQRELNEAHAEISNSNNRRETA